MIQMAKAAVVAALCRKIDSSAQRICKKQFQSKEASSRRPQAALDDQNSLLPSPTQRLPKVLLPHQRSLQEPCSKGVAWDLKFAAFGRHSATVARHLNAKQLALSVMLFRSSSLLLLSK